MNEIRDHCEAAFQWVTKEGVLVEENMRGVRINIEDAVIAKFYSMKPGGG